MTGEKTSKRVFRNYLALGRGRGFLINDIEVATAQLWGRPTLGRADIAEAFKARKLYSSREWKRLYSDGTVVEMAPAGQRLLHDGCRRRRTRAGRRLFRHAALPCNRRLNPQGGTRSHGRSIPGGGGLAERTKFQRIFNVLCPHSNVTTAPLQATFQQ
ncbi:hypothetical protein ABIF99_006865 [Bradyrhizobium japonicum]